MTLYLSRSIFDCGMAYISGGLMQQTSCLQNHWETPYMIIRKDSKMQLNAPLEFWRTFKLKQSNFTLTADQNSLKRDRFVNSVNLQKTRHVSKNNELMGLKQRTFSGNNRICPNYDSPDFKSADIPIQRQFQVFVQNNHVFLNRS